jgi:hypothetical protein
MKADNEEEKARRIVLENYEKQRCIAAGRGRSVPLNLEL